MVLTNVAPVVIMVAVFMAISVVFVDVVAVVTYAVAAAAIHNEPVPVTVIDIQCLLL